MRKDAVRIFIALLLVLFCALPSFSAGTQIRRPTADESSTGTWVAFGGDGSYYNKVYEAVPDDDGSYIYATANGRNRFDFTLFSIPTTAAVSKLSIVYRHKKTAPQACNIRSALLVGGTTYDTTDPGIDPTRNVWNTTTYDYTTNPKTSVAWIPDDINGISANSIEAFGVYTNDASPNPFVTQVYAEVTYNSAPILNNGSSESVLPMPSQATDGSGDITITFRIKDAETDLCSVEAGSFYYQVNGGGWNPISDSDITGTKTGLTSAVDYTGALHTLVWDTSKEYIDDADSVDVQIRFKVNDGTVASANGDSPLGFDVDNLDPAALVTTDITTQPSAGVTDVTLDCSFTEIHPNTNTFYLAINGGAYGSGTAGDSGTADPSAQATGAGATLLGDDYVSKVMCTHVDDFGNVGTNESLAPTASRKYVKPYTPLAPTVGNPTASTVDVTINKHASEVVGLEYAIYVTKEAENRYVQMDGTLGVTASWETIANWGTKTVTGLSSPVSQYRFQTKSRNTSDAAHQASSESALGPGASASNVAPILNNGASDNVLPVPSQATDGSGDITITFRIKDAESDACSVVNGSFYYQVNAGAWNAIADGDITGTKTGLTSATDFTGPVHSLVWDTSKDYIDDADSVDVRIRFQVNDGTDNSAYGISPVGFDIDNLDPAPLVTTEIYTQPLGGDTTVTLDCSFTETHPDTNTFYLAINGGAYGSSTAGDTGTADPSPQATAVGATLEGNDYVNKVRCVHVDDFGNVGTSESLTPDSIKKYIKPYTPLAPTVDSPTASTVDVAVNRLTAEATGLEYAIYVTKEAENKYVQMDGTLGDAASWETITNWGTKTVTGLSSPVSQYTFYEKSRNISDTADQITSQSVLSDGANSGGLAPTTPEVTSYSPTDEVINVTPEADVIVTFNLDMNTTSVQNAFSMKAILDNQGNSLDLFVNGSYSWTGSQTLTFTPTALTKGYSYRVTVSKEATDTNGNPMLEDKTWSFRVIFDKDRQNTFISSDGLAKVTLGVGALSSDGWIDINRDPINDPQEVNPNDILTADNKVAAEGNPYHYPIISSITEFDAYDTNGSRDTSTFNAPVTVTLYYTDSNSDGFVDGSNPPINEQSLLIYWLDEINQLWVRVPGSTVNTVLNYVTAPVQHFSVYTLMSTPAQDLSSAFAFPVPYRPDLGHSTITFTNLSSTAIIRIYDSGGNLVATLNETDGDGQYSWDVKSTSGGELASGVYFFHIKGPEDSKAGKLLIIK